MRYFTIPSGSPRAKNIGYSDCPTDEVTLAGLRWRSKRYRGKRCHECGGKNMLGVHHIDGNPGNNEQKNLLTLCASCHTSWHWRNGKRMPRRQSVCTVCGHPARKLDMCQKHYQRYRKYGDPSLTKVRIGSSYVLCREIPGDKGNGHKYIALPAE